MAAPSQLVGHTLGHYCILDRIGAGGMGVVYRAYDTRLDRDVVVKVLPQGALLDHKARKRFRKEAIALAKLNHPNIATIYDFDTQDETDFLVMEYVAGTTLTEMLRAGALSEKQTCAIGEQAAKALDCAHVTGLVHRAQMVAGGAPPRLARGAGAVRGGRSRPGGRACGRPGASRFQAGKHNDLAYRPCEIARFWNLGVAEIRAATGGDQNCQRFSRVSRNPALYVP